MAADGNIVTETVVTLAKNFFTYEWNKQLYRGAHVTSIPSGELPDFLEGEFVRLGVKLRQRSFRETGRSFRETGVGNQVLTYNCPRASGRKAVSSPNLKRGRSKRPVVSLDCPAYLKVLYPIGSDPDHTDPDICLEVRYRDHCAECLSASLAAPGQTILLSSFSRDRLDSICIQNPNTFAASIVEKYQDIYLAEAKKHYGLGTKNEVLVRWQSNPLEAPRDFYITEKDAQNAMARVNQDLHRLADNDAESVRQMVLSQPDNFLFHQEQNSSKPFIIVFATPDMISAAKEFGHKRTLCMDATFGTNRYKFALTTIFVFDGKKGIPIAWAIHSSETAETVLKILDILAEKLGGKDNFLPARVLIDDAAAEVSAVKQSLWGRAGTEYVLCIWHVKRSWLVNVIKKVGDKAERDFIFDYLGSLIYFTTVAAAKSAIEGFIDILLSKENTKSYAEYLRDNWVHNVDSWCLAGRNTLDANEELISTSSSIEAYHGVLKLCELGVKIRVKGRRLDWLIFTLLTKVSLKFLRRRVVQSGLQAIYELMSRKAAAAEADVEATPGWEANSYTNVNDANVVEEEYEPFFLVPEDFNDEASLEYEMGILRESTEIWFATLLRKGSLERVMRAKKSMLDLIRLENVDSNTTDFVKNPGSLSRVRRDPVVLGGFSGGSRKKRRKSITTNNVKNIPAAPFQANKKAGRPGVGRSLKAKLAKATGFGPQSSQVLDHAAADLLRLPHQVLEDVVPPDVVPPTA